MILIDSGHPVISEHALGTWESPNIAKNIIVFVGSGMSQATVTAARTHKGGENATFAFEKLKWSGNVRTYCVDSRVPDSACASTAFLTGVKSNLGTVAVHPTVKRGDCVATNDKVKQLESIAKWALDAGRVVGFATTSRVTAGSNAALYAHSSDKDWENDASVTAAGCNASQVNDIAYQLINGDVGKHFKVIFGGGRKNFIPNTETDASGARGLRTDGKNLIQEWKESKTGNAVYITTNARDTNILTGAGTSDRDSKPYLSLAYATGPSYDSYYQPNEGRVNPLAVLQATATEKEQTCSAAVPMSEGVNGGEDASVYATGPWAFMLSGGYEQNFIAHAITFASCITDVCGGASSVVVSTAVLLLALAVRVFA
ncbi:hypothetical protein RP20_CCG017616 [Aedes albopictus]|nr:hypothetical protein RP20_CCG017616 [Aedes albopictus]